MRTRLAVVALACGLGLFSSHLAAQVAQAPRTPPAPNCLDARELAEMRQPDARTLSIATTDQRFFKLELQRDCPGLEADDKTTLWGREGWICGGGREFVRGAGQDCPISSSQPMAADEHARLARLANQNTPPTLAAVQVRGNKRPGQRGFRGTPSYCFAPRYMRAWSEDPKGVVVEVSPVHSGGNRYYRVELAGSCPMLDRATSISFVSGMDLGIICGNAGDQLVVQRETLTPFAGGEPGSHSSLSRPDPGRLSAVAARCGVSAVYPKP